MFWARTVTLRRREGAVTSALPVLRLPLVEPTRIERRALSVHIIDTAYSFWILMCH